MKEKDNELFNKRNIPIKNLTILNNNRATTTSISKRKIKTDFSITLNGEKLETDEPNLIRKTTTSNNKRTIHFSKFKNKINYINQNGKNIKNIPYLETFEFINSLPNENLQSSKNIDFEQNNQHFNNKQMRTIIEKKLMKSLNISTKKESINNIPETSHDLDHYFITPLLKNDAKSLRKSTCEEFLNSIYPQQRSNSNFRTYIDMKKTIKKAIIFKKESADKFLDLKNYKLAKKILENLRKTFEEIFNDAKINKLTKSETHTKINEFLNQFLENLYKIPQLLLDCIEIRHEKDEILKKLNNVTQEILITRNHALYIESLKILGKIYKIYGNYQKSLQTYSQALTIATKYELIKLKMKLHKRLGNLYLGVQNFQKSKSHYIKALHLSWLIESEKYELIFYDCLGMIYYYEGHLEKAKFYHERMINSVLEEKNSSIRTLSINKIKNRTEIRKTRENGLNFGDSNPISSDEEDDALFESKQNIDRFSYKTKEGKLHKTYQEKQSMIVRNAGSSMFKRSNNSKESELYTEVKNKLSLKKQQERSLFNLIEVSKKIDLNKVFGPLPHNITENFLKKFAGETKNPSNFNFGLSQLKGVYGVEKSIIVREEQKIKNYRIMKVVSLNKDMHFISHLSSNRNLDRYQRLMTKRLFNNNEQCLDTEIFLDKKTSNKIKKLLNRFKSNIQIALSRIESLKRQRMLSPNESKEISPKRRGALPIT